MFDRAPVSLAAVTDRSEADIPTAALRSALEFAVMMAAMGRSMQPRLASPPGLRPFLTTRTVPTKGLAAVRTAVEGDDEFRARLSAGAVAELVDDVGRLWLGRPDGWLDQVWGLLDAGGAKPEAETTVRAEAKRREAAEAAAVRARLEVVALQGQVTELQRQLAEVTSDRDQHIAQVERLQTQLREAQASARKTAAKGASDERERLQAELDAARAETVAVRALLDDVLADRAEEGPAVDVDRLRELLLEALSSTGAVSTASRKPRPSARRVAVPIPGGRLGSSRDTAEFLVRTKGIIVLVDGYNVAKLGWPALSLEQQRERLLAACESLTRTTGCNLHIVFDGADVVGAHTSKRSVVRVSWSPAGVTADDVLRAEVKALDPARPVVVVTNDRAVLDDVRGMGANTVSSDAFLELLRG